MVQASRDPLQWLRKSKSLRAWLLLLALASAAAGFHAASHLVQAASHGALTAPLSQDDDSDDDATARHLECPACRMVGAWSLALAPNATWELYAVADEPSVHRPGRATAPAADAVALWQQALKHGPPERSR